MKPEAMLQELEAAAASLSVKVSYEALGTSVGGGGLCRVKGQYRVIIDKRASPRERVATLAQALAQTGALESDLVLSPSLREVLDYYDMRRAS